MRRGRSAPAAIMAVLGGGTIAHLVWPVGPTGQLSYLLVTVGAAVLGWLGVVRSRATTRVAWGLLAAGVSLSAIADVIYAVLSWSQDGPDVSICDVFWLASYVALFAGLLQLLLRSTSTERFELDSLLDLGAMTTLALLAVWQYTVSNILADSSTSVLTRWVWAAYPLLDAALLALVARSVVNRRLRAIAGPWLVLGISGWLVSDFGTIVAGDSAGMTRWLDLGWMLGAVWLGVSTWQAAGQGDAEPEPERTVRTWDYSRLVIGLLPLLAPGAIDTWMTSRGVDPAPAPLFISTIVLAALAFARSVLLLQRGRRSEALTLSSQRYFSALAANSSDAVIVVDRDGCIINEDAKVAAVFGDGSTIRGRVLANYHKSIPGLQAAAPLFDPQVVAPGCVQELEVEFVTNEGVSLWASGRSVNLLDNPDVQGIVVNFVDITGRREAEALLDHHQLHDSLTGLANRVLFRDRVGHALQRGGRTGLEIAVVSVDLDGFRSINERAGADSGDVILRDASSRLVDVVRAGDTVARLGADEFGILLEQSPNAVVEATALADRILRLLADTTAPDGRNLGLTASIGITISDANSTVAALLAQADLAMNEARRLGRARCVLFDAAMAEEAEARIALERDLVTALDNDEFRLVYQPVIELQTGKTVGFEALIRWQHPTRGNVGPDAFIALAERSGDITRIGRWVLMTACAQGARWQQLKPTEPPLSMAVNISGVQLASEGLLDDVADALAQSGLRPDSLVLELTETVLVSNPAGGAKKLGLLRALGARIAIDDFGTGYSSLSYLRQFPVDILKIDRSFIQTITTPNELPALVGGLLGLAHALELETIAEGIEDDVQLDCLRDANCDLAQGYLFAKPLQVAEIDRLLSVAQAPTVPSIASRSRSA